MQLSSDVLIHINEMPNQSEQGKLVEQLRNLEGFVAPSFRKGAYAFRFLQLRYDRCHSFAGKGKGNGFKAQLVGM